MTQGIIGSGTDSYEKETGQTDSLGMEDTHAETNGNTMSINFWGLENWWGNKYEFIDNVVVNPPRIKVQRSSRDTYADVGCKHSVLL